MEKLTEKLNAMAVSSTTKERIVKIAEAEQLQIQQVCRRLIKAGLTAYEETDKNNEIFKI